MRLHIRKIAMISNTTKRVQIDKNLKYIYIFVVY